MIQPLPQDTVNRAVQGDKRAFREVVESHQRFAYAIAYRMVGNRAEAEDITQEAFVRLWHHLPKYRTGIKLSTWLFRIVTNLCLDLLKSARRKRQRLHDDIAFAGNVASASSPEQTMIGKEIRIEVEKATASLPSLQKAVFVLRDLEAVPVAEVCEILSLTAEQVKSNLCHARRKIAEQLKHLSNR